MYDAFLESLRQSERDRTAFITCEADAETLQEMLGEINDLGYNFCYLADLTVVKIEADVECIIERYIDRFIKEGPRAYLVATLDIRKRDNDLRILKLYQHFRQSDEFIAAPGKPAPAHIYVRYDNTFARLRTKRICPDLIAIVQNPRDAAYLPFTLQMLARHKYPEVFELLLCYLECEHLTNDDFGIEDNRGSNYYPSVDFMKSELRFSAIAGLKYYPSAETVAILTNLLCDKNRDVQVSARKSLKTIQNLGY